MAVEVGERESQTNWSDVFKALKQRGLRGVKIVLQSISYQSINVSVYVQPRLERSDLKDRSHIRVVSSQTNKLFYVW